MKYEVTFKATVTANNEKEASLEGFKAIFGGSEGKETVTLTLEDANGSVKDVTVDVTEGNEYAGWNGLGFFMG